MSLCIYGHAANVLYWWSSLKHTPDCNCMTLSFQTILMMRHYYRNWVIKNAHIITQVWFPVAINYETIPLKYLLLRQCKCVNGRIITRNCKCWVLWPYAHNMESPYQWPRTDAFSFVRFQEKLTWSIFGVGCIPHTEIGLEKPPIPTFTPS